MLPRPFRFLKNLKILYDFTKRKRLMKCSLMVNKFEKRGTMQSSNLKHSYKNCHNCTLCCVITAAWVTTEKIEFVLKGKESKLEISDHVWNLKRSDHVWSLFYVFFCILNFLRMPFISRFCILSFPKPTRFNRPDPS